MMVRRRRSFENGCRGRRWVWLTGLLIVLAVGIPIALACDVTKVDLWIGDDEAAATGENENTVYKEAGESFGWFVKWEAGGATSGDYEGEVYLEGVEEDTFTKSAAPWEASGSVTIPTDMPVGTGKKVEAKVRKVDSSVELTAEVTNLTVVSFKIDTSDSFPVYVAVGDTLALGCTFEPTDVTGETYLWTKDSGPGTVTFSPSATTEDPTFSADTAGKYKVKAECSIGGYTFDDTTKGDIVVVASGSLVLEDLHTGNSAPIHRLRIRSTVGLTPTRRGTSSSGWWIRIPGPVMTGKSRPGARAERSMNRTTTKTRQTISKPGRNTRLR